METKESSNAGPGAEIDAGKAADVSGGDCGTTVSVGPVTVTGGGSPADAMIAIYDGAVTTTSHIIETVANATK